tara:strand:- start:41 stop:217 length:177 start_codon:yes stop_codon:yes gene_type:complete
LSAYKKINMIKNIIDLLQVVKGETNNIRFAQGSNALPKNLRGAVRLIKKTIKDGSKGI